MTNVATTFSTIATVAATLLGIGLALVALLPAVLEMLASRGGSSFEQSLSSRRIRLYLFGVALATVLFAVAAIVSLLGLATSYSQLTLPALLTCIGGMVILSIVCGAVLRELGPLLLR